MPKETGLGRSTVSLFSIIVPYISLMRTPRMLSTASTAVRSPLCLLLAFLPNMPNGKLLELEFEPLEAAPGRHCLGDPLRPSAQVLCFLLLMVLLGARSLLASAASKKCPAAVSATVMIGAQMASGYVLDVLCTWDIGLPRRADILGFKKHLNLATIAGAHMMLLAAVTMAFTKQPRKAEPVPRWDVLV